MSPLALFFVSLERKIKFLSMQTGKPCKTADYKYVEQQSEVILSSRVVDEFFVICFFFLENDEVLLNRR